MSAGSQTVGQGFHCAVAKNGLAFFGLILQQGEDQFVFAQSIGALDAVGYSHVE